MNAQQPVGHYAAIHGLKLYYEIHGEGRPLVLLHGGGSTIESTYGRILPLLACHRRVIAIELQAHGRTADIDRTLSFEQDADDVAALLSQLRIDKADFMGFSNGGTTCLQIAIRHPQLVRKLVLASALAKRSGVPPVFWEAMQQGSLKDMPQPLKEAFLAVNPDPKALEAMFHRDATRMQQFRDISDEALHSVQAPALILNGDAEVILAEHALFLYRVLPQARLAILPSGHGDYIGEVCAPGHDSTLPAMSVALIHEFLGKD